jgi:hypothetical protein
MNLSEVEKTPFFFIIGRPRSGTTMLKSLFDAHPNIIVPIEFPIIRELSYKYSKKNIWSKQDLTEFFNDISKTRFSEFNDTINYFELNKVNQEKLFKDLMECEGNTSFTTVIKVLYLNTFSVFPKENILLFGDKNPIYSMYVKEIFKIFPEAKYIHLIRDYRDHALSLLKLKVYQIPSIALIAYQWKRSLRMTDKVKRKHPDNFYTIKYEDLVLSPKPEMKKIFDFLGIAFNETILNFNTKIQREFSTATNIDEFKNYHNNLINPVNTSSVNKWKTEMDKNSQMIADISVGNYAEKYGYERTFKNKFIRYLIPVLIMKAYVQLQFGLRSIINPLPFSLKYKIQKRKSLFMNLFNRIFKKI